jgi:hypothetical protein
MHYSRRYQSLDATDVTLMVRINLLEQFPASSVSNQIGRSGIAKAALAVTLAHSLQLEAMRPLTFHDRLARKMPQPLARMNVDSGKRRWALAEKFCIFHHHLTFFRRC